MGANPSIHPPCSTIEEWVVCETWSHLQSEKENFGVLLNVNHVVCLGFSLKGLCHLLHRELEDLVFCNDNTCCWWYLCGIDELYCDLSFQRRFVNRHLVWGLNFRGGKWCQGLNLSSGCQRRLERDL